jgi:histidine ammonia-lyase
VSLSTLQYARYGAGLRLDEAIFSSIEESAKAVQAILDQGKIIYGMSIFHPSRPEN